MIQRIQSLYLSLTILLSLLFLKGSYLNFIDKSGSLIKVTFSGLMRDTTGQGFELIQKLLPLYVIIILIPALSVITILLFKNLRIQLWLTFSVIIFVVVFLIELLIYSLIITSRFEAEIVAGFKMIIPLLMLIFTILAYRGIRKDDRLIKSLDRLR